MVNEHPVGDQALADTAIVGHVPHEVLPLYTPYESFIQHGF